MLTVSRMPKYACLPTNYRRLAGMPSLEAWRIPLTCNPLCYDSNCFLATTSSPLFVFTEILNKEILREQGRKLNKQGSLAMLHKIQ